VADPCGLAGGTPWGDDVSEWGEYASTTHAKHGDSGSKVLKKNATLGISTWTIGQEVEVVWQITANHGGGYQYRLCPADRDLTEECFRETPLDFNQDKQHILLENGTRVHISGTFVSEGTEPMGSTWAMNPIPPTCLGGGCINAPKVFNSSWFNDTCKECPLPVYHSDGIARDCTSCDNTFLPSFDPPCEGCAGNEGTASVVDSVKVPSSLSAGEYVLQWRMDCEATAQVWTNCADVSLVN